MRLLRASLVSLLLLSLLTGVVNAQTCSPLQGVQVTLEGAQFSCRTSTGGTYTAAEIGGGTSTHQWVYATSSSGPWTPITGATGRTYRLTGSDFPSSGFWWIAVTSTPQCGSPITGGAQSVTVYDTLPAPEMFGNDQICGNATSAIASASAQWDSYSWSITHGTLIPGSNGCGDDPTKRCVSFRPDGTGEVHLSLTVTAGSCSSSALRAIPVVDNAPPQLWVSTPVCPGGQGSAVTSQFPAGVHAWSVTNGHIESNWGDHIFFVADGSGPVDVTLIFTDTNGCSSTSTARANLVATKPVITLGTPSACATSDTATASGGWDSYDWSITNGSITSGQGTANVSFSASGAGAATVLTVTGHTNYSTFSCSSASDPVTVPTMPPPAITLDTADICPYGGDTATAPPGYANYWWSLNNGYITAGDGTNSIRFSRGGYPNNPDEPITVSLFVADANGCSLPQARVTVPTRTIPPPTITLDTPDICPYGTDTASVPAQYANYWWTLNNGYIMSGDGTNSIRFARGGYPNNPDEPITIRLYVQDANGCPAQASMVTVPTRSIPPPIITLGTPDICPYGTDTATVPAQYTGYWWTLNNGNIMSGDGTNSIRFSRGGYPNNPDEPITIRLYVQDGNGCPAQADMVTVPTRVLTPPTITLGTPDICPYGTDTATVPAQYTGYWWTVNNGSITSGDGTNSITFSRGGYPYNPDEPITIRLYVQDANGCPAQADMVTVPTRSIPSPTITLATPDVCLHGTDTASVPAQYANYWWSITGGSIIGNQNSSSVTFAPDQTNGGPVTLSLYVQDGNGCPASSGDVVVPIRILAPPVITASGSTSLCGGGSVTLTAPAGFTYSWSNGATARAITVTQPGDYFVTVSDSGCTATSSPVHVTAATPSALVITTLHDTTCLYGTIQATISNPSLFSNITWSAVGGAITPNGASSFTEATDGTVGQVSITAHATDVATGCAVSATVVIPIVPLDPPVMTVSSNGPICYGTPVTISIPAQPAGSQIYWDYTGVKLGGGDGQTFITLSAPPSPSFSLRVRLTDPRFCTTQNTIVVPVHLPVVPVLQADDRYGCAYAEKTVTVTNPSAYTSYSWSVTNGTIVGPNDQPTVHVALMGPGVTTDVTFTASDGSCPINGYASFYATQPTASISGGSGTYCTGTTVTLTASTDASNATYHWSNGATSSSITASAGAPGPYTVTVTNAYGCSTTSAPLTVHFAPQSTTVNASGPTTFCAGGSVTLTPAMVGDSYAWSNGATTRTINVTQSGAYSVTVTSAACQYVSPATTVTVNPLPAATISASGPTTFCAGGSVTLTASAGSTYSWSNGATTQSITVTTAGNYSVTVTTASNCSATSQPVAVTVNAVPDATITAPSSVCASTNGDNAHVTSIFNGTYAWTISGGTITGGAGTYQIAFRPSGGDPVTLGVTVTNASGCAVSSTRVVDVHSVPKPAVTPSGAASFCNSGLLTAPAGYTAYSWKRDGGQISGASAQTYVATISGTYSVIVFDSANCWVESDPVSITVSTTPVASISAQNNVCAGSTYGAVSAGSAPSYQWSVTNGTIVDGQGTQVIHYTSGASGNVTLTLTVANAQGCSDTKSINIPIANVQATITPSGPLTICPNGSVTLTASAGAGYNWSNNTHAQSITVTQAGTYSVRVFDASGCSALSQSVTVSVAAPSATITPSGPTTFCAGGNVTLSAPSGYSYSWSTGATTQSITVNQSNTYTVTVQDANGCTASSSKTVTVNPLPTATVSGSSAICPGGSTTITATLTGTAPWTVTWSDNVTQTINSGTTATRSVNPSATTAYTIASLTDANCTGTSAGSATVTVNSIPTAIVSGSAAICPGGSATISATLTGTAPFTVIWSDNVTQTINSGSTASRSVNPSATTTYTVSSLTDANCTGTSSGAATITIRPLPTAAVSGTAAICSGASTTITAALTGTAPFTVTWSDNVTQTINSGSTASRSVNPSATTTYTVTSLTDANCSGTSSGAATITVRALPTAVVSGGGAICAGSSATITATLTGTAPWTVTWSDTVTQTINSGTTASRSVNPSATTTYTVSSLTDANCSGTASGSATVTVNPIPTAVVSGTAAICAGGSATISAALTGTAPFTVTWSDNVTQTINSGTTASRSVNPSATTTYTVTSLTDANCSGTSSGSATVTVSARPAAIVSGSAAICAGASTTITAALTGTAPFTVTWSDNVTQTINSGTTASRSVSPSATTSYSVTSLADANCSGTSSGSATITVRPLPTVVVSGTNAICPGGSTTITATLTGTAPWTVIWSDNVTQTINSGTTASRSVNPSTTTTYSVSSLTDANCSGTASGSATVTVNPRPTAIVSGTGAICPGGSATITATLTGSAPFTVMWSDNVTQTINSGTTATRSVSPVATQTYTVTSIADANCTGTSSGSATVTLKTLPTAAVSGGGTICPGGSATISATLTGTAPFTVIWSDNVTQTINSGTTATRSVSPSATTIYTMTSVSDAGGCSRAGSGSAAVTVKTLPTATVSGGGAICPGASATITADLTGTAPWSVTWSDNVTQTINSGTTATRTVSPSVNTTYTVTSITDASSCAAVAGSGSATVTRSVAASITTQPANKSTSINTNVTVSVVAAGTSPIFYQWFKNNGTIVTGATSSSYTTSFPAKGNYQFYVEVWNACNTTHVKSHNVTVTVN